MTVSSPVESPATYDREILAALRRVAWRDAERWVRVDLGDPWNFVCGMPAPAEVGFSAAQRCQFVLERLRALADSGEIRSAWREIDGRPRFGYIVPRRQSSRAKVRTSRISEFDRRFLSEIRVGWDSPAQTGTAGAGRGTRGTEPRAIAAAGGDR